MSSLDDALRLSRRTLWIGTGLALLSAALYGANIPAARVASQAGLPGADMIAWRALLLVPLLFVLAKALGQSLSLAPAERGATLRLAIAASFTAIFYLSAIDHLPVPIAVIVFYTFPLIVMLVSTRLEGRRLQPMQIGVFCVAFLGLVLAIGPSFAGLASIGLIYAGLAACASASMFIVAGNAPNAPIKMMFWTQIAMGPLAAFFSLMRGGIAPIEVFHQAPIAISLAIGAYAVAYGIQLSAAQKISAGRAGLLFLFEPVVAIIVAGFFLSEHLNLLQWLGLGLILAALATEILLDGQRVDPA